MPIDLNVFCAIDSPPKPTVIIIIVAWINFSSKINGRFSLKVLLENYY